MIDDRELFDRAVEAYIYAYPLVLMDATRSLALHPAAADAGAPPAAANTFKHLRAFPDDTFTAVVRPNVDTLYSQVWFDVSERPLLVRVPATGDRYYVLPFMDMWTDVFASVGPRTTGNEAREFLLVAPGWTGTPPAGTTVIQSPTVWGWIIGRTQTNGAADYPAVHRVQDQFSVESVDVGSSPARQTIPVNVPSPAPPVQVVDAMNAEEFFERFATLQRIIDPHVSDQAQLARLEPLGLDPAQTFSFADASPKVRNALDEALRAAPHRIRNLDPRRAWNTNGWTSRLGTGNYGIDYRTRASVAFGGLGALPPQDAVYPHIVVDADGAALTGANRYRLHFDAGETPPAAAFWSLTMYGEDQFLVANPAGRYAIGDRDPLAFNPDGSLDILIQHDDPGAAAETNWLPAPAGNFTMNLRLYLPDPAVEEGDWAPPPLHRIS